MGRTELLFFLFISAADTYLFSLFQSLFYYVKTKGKNWRFFFRTIFLSLLFTTGLFHMPGRFWWFLTLIIITDFALMLLACDGLELKLLKWVVCYDLFSIAVYYGVSIGVCMYYDIQLSLDFPFRIQVTEELMIASIIVMIKFMVWTLVLLIQHPQKPVLKKRHIILMQIPTLIFFICALLVLPYCILYEDENQFHVLVAVAVFGMGMCFLICYLLMELRRGVEQFHSLKEEYMGQREYFKELRERQRILHKIAHDRHHHISYLRSVLEYQDIERALEYLHSLDQSVLNVKEVAYTGNPDIDVILSIKCAEAKEKDLVIKISGTLPENLAFDPVDINIILGNAVDNAIQASCEVLNPAAIEVGFGYHNHMFLFRISNQYHGRLQKRGRTKYRSTKGSNRGIGMEIIKNITEKYDGIMAADHNDTTFLLMIILQEQKGSSQKS